MKYDNPGSKKTKLTIVILSSLVVLLLLVIAFFFVVQPQVNKFAYNKQIEGANIVYMDILQKVQANGYYSMPVGNQTLVLVPYVPQNQQLAETTQQ